MRCKERAGLFLPFDACWIGLLKSNIATVQAVLLQNDWSVHPCK